MSGKSTCPVCGNGDCNVSESFAQATRSKPMTSLGFSGYCRKCDVSFRLAEAR